MFKTRLKLMALAVMGLAVGASVTQAAPIVTFAAQPVSSTPPSFPSPERAVRGNWLPGLALSATQGNRE